MKPTLTVTKDLTEKFKETISRFKSDSVRVGIPQSDSPRKDDDPINNAAILAINNFGSPANNIPARPVLEIGIRKAQDAIADQFKKCAEDSWIQGIPAIGLYYERAGIIASNAVKNAINDQDGIEHISFVTAMARVHAGFKGDKALLVTGQLRNAITYVVKTRGGL